MMDDENSYRPSPFYSELIMEQVMLKLEKDEDRASASLVCSLWRTLERSTRRREKLVIRDCESVSPQDVISKNNKVTIVIIKGKPRLRIRCMPTRGPDIQQWLVALGTAYPGLIEIQIKRLTVTDESLLLLANSFKCLESLSLMRSPGFSLLGLAAIATRCRNLTKLDVVECGSDLSGEWMSSFPGEMLSLEVLQFPYLRSYADFSRLEKLLVRCCNIKVLNVMRHSSVDELKRLLWYAAQLNEFGVGEISPNSCLEIEAGLNHALSNCEGLHALSITWPAYGNKPPAFLPGLYTSCRSLSFLDLSTAALRPRDLELLSFCPHLRCLWVMDTVQDEGLIEISSRCKLLEDVRVFPEKPSRTGSCTEIGLVALSEGCPNLRYIFYVCRRMTNEAISGIVRNCVNVSHFRLGILSKVQYDYKTGECFDSSLRNIVMSYKNLKRLSVFGMLTEDGFNDIGKYAERLETLSVAIFTTSFGGLESIVQGCPMLKKVVLHEGYEVGLYMWFSTCNLTLNGRQLLLRTDVRRRPCVTLRKLGFDNVGCIEEHDGKDR